MRSRLISELISVLLLAVSLPAQDAKAPAVTFQTQSQLVLVPAVVSEAGIDIHGLRAGDFVVLHNGKPEPISVFEEVTAAPGRPSQEPLPPRVAQNYGSAIAHLDTHILLLDFFGADVWTKESIERQLLPIAQLFADRHIPLSVLVFSYNGLTQVQSLADDPADFLEAVKLWAADHPHKLKVGDATPQWSSSFRPIGAEKTAELLRAYALDRPSSPKKGILEKGYEFDAFAMRLRAMKQMVEAFRGLPGRKRVIWYGAAPASVWFPDPNFVLYPILVLHSNSDGKGFSHGYNRGYDLHCVGAGVDSLTNLMEYPTRPDLCTDHPAQCVQRFLGDGGSYYTLGFYLNDRNSSPGLHRLDVKVDRPKAVIRARDAFTIDMPSNASKEAAREASRKAIKALLRTSVHPDRWAGEEALIAFNPVNEQQQVLEALGSPLDYTALPLRLEWSPESGGATNVVELTVTAPPGAITGIGTPPVVRISIVVYVRTGDGQEQFLNGGITRALPPELQDRLAREGFVYHTRLTAPADSFDVRVLVRDADTNRIGTVSATVELPAATATLNP